MKNKLIIPIMAAFLLTVCQLSANNPFANEQNNKKESLIVTLTSKNYDVETSKGLVIVDFWAVWCGPCRKMNPILEEIADEMKSTVKIGKLNVDNYKKLAVDKGIQSIPTMIVYKDGKEIDRVVGTTSKEALKKAITSYAGKK